MKKQRLNSDNICYLSVGLEHVHVNVSIHGVIGLLYLGFQTSRTGYLMSAFEEAELRRTLGLLPSKFYKGQLHNLYSTPNVPEVIL
jgi:hypothetical protein